MTIEEQEAINMNKTADWLYNVVQVDPIPSNGRVPIVKFEHWLHGKAIELEFPFQFDVSSATRQIERDGIGSGSFSITGSTIIFTVNSPVSVPAATSIRLEIGRIVNSNVPGNFAVEIRTKDLGGNLIDGPTFSSGFSIKSITGDDVKDLMIHKTMFDNAVGHTHGWNPDDTTTHFNIIDNDLTGVVNGVLVSANINSELCVVQSTSGSPYNTIGVMCAEAPTNGADLEYIIYKVPNHNVVN